MQLEYILLKEEQLLVIPLSREPSDLWWPENTFN